MKRQEMLDTARREMAHIPDWPDYQRRLRMHFFNNRLHSLKAGSDYPDDPLEVLKISMRDARQSADVKPDQRFEYDKAFFEEESRKWKKRG